MICTYLETWTSQQVFNHIVNHLMTQKQRSTVRSDPRDKDRCVYRNRNGLKCAAGCLILEDEYDESIECNDWGSLANASLVPETHSKLIRELQRLHDNSVDASCWKEELKELGKRWELSLPEILL